MTHRMPPADVALHVRELRDLCRRYRGWDLERVAEEIGVRRHTLSQYCQLPETKGARTIPADRLDVLRAAAAEPALRYDSKEIMALARPYREARVWHAYTATALPVPRIGRFASECWAARNDGFAHPCPGHPEPDKPLTDDEARCVEWLRFRHGGLVGRATACQLADVDEHSEGLVGYELPAWRIVPTRKRVDAIIDAHGERFRHATA